MDVYDLPEELLEPFNDGNLRHVEGYEWEGWHEDLWDWRPREVIRFNENRPGWTVVRLQRRSIFF